MSVLMVCEWLESTSIGILVRESLYGFPIVVAIHILGLALSVGTLVWFDLRLLGVSMQRCPVSQVYRRLMPWMLTGFAIMFISGGVLFAGFATKAYANVYFRLKLGAIVFAGVNAAAFHFGAERGIGRWDRDSRPPLPARVAGLMSIIAWTAVILAGRMMSYTMF